MFKLAKLLFSFFSARLLNSVATLFKGSTNTKISKLGVVKGIINPT